MKCEICRETVAELFLNKLKGTYIKDEKGKKHVVCFDCQKKFQTKEELLKQI